MNASQTTSAILLIHCKDQPDIVVAITDFIFHNSGNTLKLDQHVDAEHQTFFMRVEWDLEKFSLDTDDIGKELGENGADLFFSNFDLTRGLALCLYMNL
jgi:formyltetrahydrofolate deformylase